MVGRALWWSCRVGICLVLIVVGVGLSGFFADFLFGVFHVGF